MLSFVLGMVAVTVVDQAKVAYMVPVTAMVSVVVESMDMVLVTGMTLRVVQEPVTEQGVD